jgi:hypothetical protein
MLVGCTLPPTTRSLDEPDPTGRIPAIRQKALSGDTRQLERLVDALDDDDPAVRFYAIRALQELTGNSFDYDYYDDELERRPALQEWQAWLAARNATTRSATQPDASPAGSL